MITITVTGPGGVISYEMAVIKKALEDHGSFVEVVDSEPKYILNESDKITPRRMKIKLIANHCHWGG